MRKTVDNPVRYIGEHQPECSAVEAVRRGEWPHPWGVATPVHADALGRQGGWRRWIRWGCNSLDCDAQVMILEDAIVGQFAVPVQEATP